MEKNTQETVIHRLGQRHTGTGSQDNFWAGLDPDSHNRQKKQKHGIDNSNIGLLLVTGQQEEVLWFLSLMQLWWIVSD